MARLCLAIALAASGLLLVLINHACSTQVAKITSEPPPAAVDVTTTARGGPASGLELPVAAGSLRDATELLRRFLTCYSSHDEHGDPADRAARLAELTTHSPGGLLASTAQDASRQQQGTATGTVSSIKIRLLAPSSIQYLATVEQTITGHSRTRHASTTYAITLVRDRNTWKVDSLALGDAGDSGESQP